jgi:dienelactone hydrolase
MRRIRTACLGLFLLAGLQSPAATHAADNPLWDTAKLAAPPAATWGQPHGLVQEVYYDGEPLDGKPTRIFAYYAKPDSAGPFPGVVLVHGGGGKAFSAWAEHWAKRGYAAIAMDLSGNGPSGHLPDGGPDQSDKSKFHDFAADQVKDMWTYHVVAAVIRGHSLLRSRPEVDPKRIALTGISWGGYLTCIVAGVDHLFKAAVPVYGCGFLDEDSFWVPILSKMSPDQRRRWVENFDPSRYIGGAQCPMLFLDGTNDFAYPPDSLQRTYRLVKSPVTLSMEINRKHGHIWTFPEVDAFIDSQINDGPPLPKLGELTTSADTASAAVSAKVPISNAELDYTTDSGPWQKRQWHLVSAVVSGNMVSAKLPADRPLVCYLRVTDQRGCSVTTPYVELIAANASINTVK